MGCSAVRAKLHMKVSLGYAIWISVILIMVTTWKSEATVTGGWGSTIWFGQYMQTANNADEVNAILGVSTNLPYVPGDWEMVTNAAAAVPTNSAESLNIHGTVTNWGVVIFEAGLVMLGTGQATFTTNTPDGTSITVYTNFMTQIGVVSDSKGNQWRTGTYSGGGSGLTNVGAPLMWASLNNATLTGGTQAYLRPNGGTVLQANFLDAAMPLFTQPTVMTSSSLGFTATNGVATTNAISFEYVVNGSIGNVAIVSGTGTIPQRLFTNTVENIPFAGGTNLYAIAVFCPYSVTGITAGVTFYK